ncbi:MAG: Acg family FMN-binding oxidoreductase [Mycobacteriales bacterium]
MWAESVTGLVVGRRMGRGGGEGAGVAVASVDLRREAEELIASAGRAPSLHNAQPWAFRVGRDSVEVHFDDRRMLPVADPVGRQAYLGLGATVFGLRLAMAVRHRAVRVDIRPDPGRPDLVALVTVTGERPPTAEEVRLAAAVPRRRTVRTPFEDEEVPVPLRLAWREHAEAEGAVLRWVERIGERSGVARLVGEADRQQLHDPAYLAELRRWTTPERVAEGAGVPSATFGVTPEVAHAAQFTLRDFGAGRRPLEPRHPGPLEEHPLVAVLATATDSADDWLRGGQALMRVLLAAADEGYAASYLNQPIELPGLRQQLRDELRLPGHPQLGLRLGRPSGPISPPTPRRPPAELLLPDTPA